MGQVGGGRGTEHGTEYCGFISLGWSGSLALEGSGPGWLAGEQFGSAWGLTRRWESGITHASSNF